jgi:WhiB family redox-sensing transcriptional regulator
MKQMSYKWMNESLCKGNREVQFFSEVMDEIKIAKSMCKICPVAPDCLEYAVKNGEILGVWGGLSQRERRKYHRLYRKTINIDMAKDIVIKYGNKIIN